MARRKPATNVTANNDGSFLLHFGWREGGEFIPSHAKKPRSYWNARAMERASARWIADQIQHAGEE